MAAAAAAAKNAAANTKSSALFLRVNAAPERREFVPAPFFFSDYS